MLILQAGFGELCSFDCCVMMNFAFEMISITTTAEEWLKWTSLRKLYMMYNAFKMLNNALKMITFAGLLVLLPILVPNGYGLALGLLRDMGCARQVSGFSVEHARNNGS